MQGDYSRWTFDPRQDYRSVVLQQGRVLLDADWNEQTELTRYHDETRTLDTIGRAGGPADGAGFGIVDSAALAPAGTAWADLRITPGRYYVDGVLCTARLPGGATGPGIPLADQPYLAAIGTDPGLAEPGTDGRYALYLDVWTHHVTADEDPWLRESALGGPDTTTRARTVWQVRAVEIPADQTCSDLHEPGWLTPSVGTMTPSLKEVPPNADPCQITTSGGYTRLENQLYRIQIHDVNAGDARYLWSRENGSVVAGLVDIGTATGPGIDAVLTLDRVGRDEELSIREGDTVEVTSTDRQLRGEPGYVATAGPPDGLALPVSWTEAAPANLAALGRAPITRRWDGPLSPISGTVADLEGGIEVSFTGGPFRTGDFWLVPARTVQLVYGLTALSGTLDWPTDGTGNPLPVPPLGPVHHITPLAILTRASGAWTSVSDCRVLVPSLNQLVSIDLIGGDGQEAPAGQPLPEPIRYAVRNGGLPVAGARIRVTAHDGTVDDETTAGAIIVTATGTDGVAAVHWTPAGAGPSAQTLVAQRLDDHDATIDVQVIATGRVSAPAGGRPPGLHVTKASLNGGGVFANDSRIPVDTFVKGISIVLSDLVLPASVEGKPVVRVVLDVPWPPHHDLNLSVWPGGPIVGFTPITLDAHVTVHGSVIVWEPTNDTVLFLTNQLFQNLTQQPNFSGSVVGRYIIDGWAVISEKDPTQHLNGHANTVMVTDPNGQPRTEVVLPTDDEVTGGQFIQWFGLEQG